MLWEAGGTCLSGAVLVGDLTWEVALSGLQGGMAPVPLYCVLSTWQGAEFFLSQAFHALTSPFLSLTHSLC